MIGSYVLITPARNEEAYIEKTIQSVVAQTKRPLKWVIVSDGSTDQTDAIVERYAKNHDFILLKRNQGDKERNFGSKVKAFNFGYESLKNLDYEFVGNLDADVSFSPMYYEGILSKFEANERLGLGGGLRYDLYKGQFFKTNTAKNSVGGSVQLFRRECFESIGGYQPCKLGGIDAVAEIKARMCGWQVENFPEFEIYHYRFTGTAGGNILRGNFRKGMQHYAIGYHPLFQIMSGISHIRDYPVVIGSVAMMSGYYWAMVKRTEKVVSDEVINYLRSEQLARLQKILHTGRDL